MSNSYKPKNHAVFLLNYHFIFCPKYRRSVLVDDIKTRCEELIKQVCFENHFEILALEVMPDHVHLFLSAPPTLAPYRIVRFIKGRTSFVLRNEFKSLVSRLPSLWTRSYFVSSAGNISTETIKRYIENQWKK